MEPDTPRSHWVALRRDPGGPGPVEPLKVSNRRGLGTSGPTASIPPPRGGNALLREGSRSPSRSCGAAATACPAHWSRVVIATRAEVRGSATARVFGRPTKGDRGAGVPHQVQHDTRGVGQADQATGGPTRDGRAPVGSQRGQAAWPLV